MRSSLFLLGLFLTQVSQVRSETTTPVIRTSPSLSIISATASSTKIETTLIPTTTATTPLQPPPNVAGVEVTSRNETSVTLEWIKLNEGYTYALDLRNTTVIDIPSEVGDRVKFTVLFLTAGIKYDWTLYTVIPSGGIRSSGFNFTAITAPPNVARVEVTSRNETSVTLEWIKLNEGYTYALDLRNTTVIDIPSEVGDRVKFTVLFLTAGIKYDWTLYTVIPSGGIRSSGFNFTAITAPPNVARVEVTSRNETSVTLEWIKLNEGYTYALDLRNTTVIDIPSEVGDRVKFTVLFLTAGIKYDWTIYTVILPEIIRSSGFNFTAITAPFNVAEVNVTSSNETSVTLAWIKLRGSYTYVLDFNNMTTINISAEDRDIVTFTVSFLIPGTKYHWTLYTVILPEVIRSSGKSVTAITTPSDVGEVKMTSRTESSVTLKWSTMTEISILNFNNGTEMNITRQEHGVVTVTIYSLTIGTKYDWTVFSVIFPEHVRSKGLNFTAITKINCTDLSWKTTNSSINAESIQGIFTNATATNTSGTGLNSPGGGMVSFTDLYPGSSYEVTLWYGTLKQCNITLTLVPPDLLAPDCGYASAGYGIALTWIQPNGVWTAMELNVTGNLPQIEMGNGQLVTQISGVQPAKTYQINVALLSGTLRSKVLTFSCPTDPRGVIAGSVMAVLILCIMICLVLLLWRWKPEILRKPKLFGLSKLSSDKFNLSRAIPQNKFPEHFNLMSADQNRGFSEEYEDFSPVGGEQTHKGADDNKAKNRFTNVYPYDWCRVKLTSLNSDVNSDYINASYIPGYSRNREYIAAQGPLPFTVNDFWRMIWEQRVNAVVMVTNCTEGGRTKCECYWPLDYIPCQYEDLLVTLKSEQIDLNWTLRDLGVKNSKTLEERTVKHFHFTAWPDHGVPDGTEALIQFRGLIREHRESDGAGSPTVVHCSAGVGRTGTLIALDVVLQQLDRERAVNISAFVHKMRLSRPIMVQTESQYVFLHQCIMDILEPKQKIEDHLYENTDLIYANADALREFKSAITSV